MLTHAQVLLANPGLFLYRVMLHEEPGDKVKLAFDCYAEDQSHAEEQAENAYPGCDISTVTLFNDAFIQ